MKNVHTTTLYLPVLVVSRGMGAILLAATILPLPGRLAAQRQKALSSEHRQQVRELQPKIDKAIDKGVAWILSTQLRDGSWGFQDERFPTGQTALCIYTLLKSGVSQSHPAIQRALANIKGRLPNRVYSAGCQLLALEATHDPAHHAHMKKIVARLLSWQEGTWVYPNHDGSLGGVHKDPDLSITQFAALGIRAAGQVGIEIPKKALITALQGVQRYQEKPRRVKNLPDASGEGTSASTMEIAGFRYRWVARTKVNGSMTTAGIASATILSRALGDRLGKSEKTNLRRLTDRALGWLEHNYTVTKNPGRAKSWHIYYLYGLERIGALLGTEYIGTHPWYLDGARVLVKSQSRKGAWSARNPPPNTCFALLFLKRATAPSTGKPVSNSRVIVAEDPASDVGFRANGGRDGSPIELWITRIGKKRKDKGETPDVSVEKVEYLVGDKVVATISPDSSKAWRGEAFPARHAFHKPGRYHVSARIHVVLKGESGKENQKHVWEAKGLDLRVEHVLAPWMLEAATANSRNLFAKTDTRVSASSVHGKAIAGHAVDQSEATSWKCEATDAKPSLSIALAKSKQADTLWITQANGQPCHAGEFDRITRVRIFLNKGKRPIEVDLSVDELAPSKIPLGRRQRIKHVRIEVVGRTPGKRYPGVAGFSEIGLLRG